MDDNKLGVITEQGDLGLGFNEVSTTEQAIIENNTKEDTKMAPDKTTK
jgi:hypothetical protein